MGDKCKWLGHFGALALLLLFSVPAMSAQVRSFHLEDATIADVHRAMLAKELTATDLVRHYLKRIDAYNGACVSGAVDAASGFQLGDITPREKAGKLNALITLNVRGRRSKTDAQDNDPAMPDALETARRLDEDFARTGKLTGPLHGIVFAVKDQFDTFDMRTTSGAAAGYANDRPPKDAEVVARLRKAGAIILAKSNLGEYASGDRSTYGGTTCNPYDTSRSAGRSSGGSGAAVAANLVTCALGEETGPSARNPASNGNLVGIVSTNSLVSRAGLIPASLTRDRPGVLCRSVVDAATVLGVIAGYDPKDPATAESVGQVPATGYVPGSADLNGVRIGVVREFMQVFTKADAEGVRLAEGAIADLKAAGATIVDPGPQGQLFKDAIAAILPSMASSMVPRDGVLPTIRLLAEREAPAVGEGLFAMNAYLKQRGDTTIRNVDDLIAHSVFFDHGAIDGVTAPPKSRLEALTARTQRFTRKSDGKELIKKTPITTLDISQWHAARTLLRMLVAKVMADNQLDALVYPTKTVPAPLLANPVEPANLETMRESVETIIDGETYVATSERVIDLRAPLTPRLSPNAGLPAVVVPAGFTREVYDRAAVPGPGGSKKPGDLLPPKPVALPISIDFLGRPFSEALLLRIAAGYEAATHHRMPPKDFGPLPGEP